MAADKHEIEGVRKEKERLTAVLLSLIFSAVIHEAQDRIAAQERKQENALQMSCEVIVFSIFFQAVDLLTVTFMNRPIVSVSTLQELSLHEDTKRHAGFSHWDLFSSLFIG